MLPISIKFFTQLFNMCLELWSNIPVIIELFSSKQINNALEVLIKEINEKNVTAEILNLTGACLRINERYAQALPILLLALQLKIDQQYVIGNIYLCLKHFDFQGGTQSQSMNETCMVNIFFCLLAVQTFLCHVHSCTF